MDPDEPYSLRDAWEAGGTLLKVTIDRSGRARGVPDANLRLSFRGDGIESDRPLSNYEIWLIRRWLLTTMPRLEPVLANTHAVRYGRPRHSGQSA